jgi:Predicted permease
VFGFFRSGAYSLPDLFHRLADLIENSRSNLPAWITSHLPTDAEALRTTLVQWLRDHTAVVSGAGRDVGRGIVHTLMGMIIGGLLTLRENARSGPWSQFGSEQVGRLALAFRRIVFAQVWISAFNTLLTWLFLGVALPLAGFHLPLTKTLILLTFVAGLLPILGNLISNSVIVLVSLSQSIWLALAALIYLMAIHKGEYFLNARIVGSHIRARAWELLIAMLAMEAAFGISGLIAAPVYYAWASAELKDRGLV